MKLRPEKAVLHERWIGIKFHLIVKVDNVIEPAILE
jgi:hypothetical protein